MSEANPVDGEEVYYFREEFNLQDRVSGTYKRVQLPDRIEELGWGEGDYAVLELVEDSHTYIRAVKAPEGEETAIPEDQYIRKISFRKSTYQLTIPPEWWEVVLDLDSNEETLNAIIEVNELEEPGHVRIYKNSEYQLSRIPELVHQGRTPISGKPIFVGFLDVNQEKQTVGEEEGEFRDIAQYTEYSGQKFEIIPFDSQHEIFVEAENPRYVRGHYPGHKLVLGNRKFFMRVKEEHDIPIVSAEKLTVRWYSDRAVVLATGALVDNEFPVDVKIIHTEYDTSGAKLILPEKGSFNFRIQRKDLDEKELIFPERTWAYYDAPHHRFDDIDPEDSEGRWRAMYYDFSDPECYKVYIPANFRERGENEVKWMMD